MDKLIGNIKWFRKQLGYSQMALAEKLQIKRSLLGAYEEGRAAVRPEILQAMASLFGVSATDLQNKDFAKGGNSPISNRPQTITPPTPELPNSEPLKTEPVYLPPQEPAYYKPELEHKPKPTAPIERPKPTPKLEDDFIAGKRLKTLTITVDAFEQELVEVVPAEAASKYADLVKNADWFSLLPKTAWPLPKGPREVYRVFDFSTDEERALLKPRWVFSRFVRNWNLLQPAKSAIFATDKAISLLMAPNEINWQEKVWETVSALGEPTKIQPDEVLEIWEPLLQLVPFAKELKEENTKADSMSEKPDANQSFEIPEAFLEVIKDLKSEVERLREAVDRKQGGQQQLSLGLPGLG